MNATTVAVPEQPRRLKSRLTVDGPRLTLSYRGFDVSGCFLFFWLIGWTVGCVWLTGAVIQKPGVVMVLFAIPFWAAWVFTFCVMLNNFFRIERFELGPEGGHFVRRVIILQRRRAIPLEEIRGFGSYKTVVDSESGTCQWGLEVQNPGRPLQFGQGLPEAERVWLVQQLNEHLWRLAPCGAHRTPDLERSDGPATAEGETSDVRERLAPAPVPLQPPSDSRWRRDYDSADLGLAMRGRLNGSAVGGLLFLNAFWNGGLSVFLVQLFSADNNPKAWGWWGEFVFLIPFEAIGLVMFLGLLATMGEPFHRRRWTFSRAGVRQHSTWFGIGPRRDYPVDRLDRIELRPHKKEPSICHRVGAQCGDQHGGYRLAFIDGRNVEAFSMEELTEGEARWMADVVLRECRWWLR